MANDSIDITEEISQNFIDFSYEANSQRAFADARDGLKPGQRACLWEMYEKGYSSKKPHVKSAKIDADRPLLFVSRNTNGKQAAPIMDGRMINME